MKPLKPCAICKKLCTGNATYCLKCFRKYRLPKTQFKKDHKTNVNKERKDLQVDKYKQKLAFILFKEGNSSMAQISRELGISHSAILRVIKINGYDHLIFNGFMNKKHSNLSKSKTSETLKKGYSSGRIIKKVGKEASNWKGGISSKNRNRINDPNWKKIRLEIIERDGFRCRECNKKLILDVHHIIPYRIIGNDNKLNLISLCKKCHMKMERKYDQFGITNPLKSLIKDNIILYFMLREDIKEMEKQIKHILGL